MGLQVKICGITKVEQGRAIARLGATALGFICVPPSPRYVAPDQIRKIVQALPVDPISGHWICDRIGVFVDADRDTILATVETGQLNGVQLHGSESPEFCQQLRSWLPTVKIIKALRVRSQEALQVASIYESIVDLLLLDAYHPTLQGGTGKTIDWQQLQHFRPDLPWFLAGGLNPDNVQEALRLLSPDGIDLSSGVEQSPGDKNLSEVARLFDNLRQ